MIVNFFKHLHTVNKHRFKVFIYCCKVGIPLRGLLHDLSKYSPVEFFEGVKYFDGKKSPIINAKKELGYSNAWLHHKGRNKHHSEYWMDLAAPTKAPVIPFKYVLEMICDRIAAAKVYQGKKYTFKRVSEVNVKPQPKPQPTDYFIVNKSYKLNSGKYLRFRPELGNNIVPYSMVDPNTKKISNNVGGKCQLKAGTIIEPERIVKETNGRIWASFGNCWWCCQNIDGTKNAVRV